MKIPDHVKRQAMDAVAHRETTDYMRRFRPDEASFDTLSRSLAANNVLTRTAPIPDHVKREAVDSIKHKDTTAQIRLLNNDGVIFAPPTPSRDAQQAAQRVTNLHQKALEVEKLHREITRGDF